VSGRRLLSRRLVAGGDRGSILLLVPAAFLVVMILASIAVDMSLVHLRQRQAQNLASSAANDTVTAAADHLALRDGRVQLAQADAEAVVGRIVAASDLAPQVVGAPVVRIRPGAVEVELTVRADYVFASVVPGAPDGTTVTATASATASTT
jgi:Putative Flp pilus-assembly TadE/G-like